MEHAGTLEGNLGDVTDEEWLEGHAKLVELVGDSDDWPTQEFTFIWDKDLDPVELIDPDEVDHSPGVDGA